ncbi:MAG: hydrogenase maturation protease [Acidimicrobiales bacterium]
MTGDRRASTVVIGIGNPMRGDDGVGPWAVEQLGRPTVPPNIDLVTLDGEPTRLVDAWKGRRLAVVIDAIVADSPPGTIHRVEVGVDLLPGRTPARSSHQTGLAEAIAFASVLDRRPDRLVIYGIEPGTLANGIGLSPPVRESMPTLLRRIGEELGAAIPDGSTD